MELLKEELIIQKYNEIINQNIEGYSLVSIALKNFREYCHRIGHEETQTIITSSKQQLLDCLQDGEYLVHLDSNVFLLLIHCDANLEHLHTRAPQFHYAIRDKMKELYEKPLYVEMGFFPIIMDQSIDYANAKYFAEISRFGPHHYYPESNYDMYYVSITDQNEAFLKLENKVDSALENGHFQLYLQPKVDAKTKEVYCAEALMRWIDPELGMIPLDSFLSNIEENGKIRDVDLYLFEKGCQYMEKWKKQYNRDIQISFNLSRAYFNGPYFYPEYREVFERYDIDSENICIELLESVVLNELEQLRDVVHSIDTLGFHCALDDFGSGFSSFDILANINLSELKLDHSLFQNFKNEKEHVLLKHIIEIAHTFNMRVVAEGIETKEYAKYLEKINCDLIQGFYYYKPMPVDEFEERFILHKEMAQA
ncbi:MAG: EAL domain-containing protein [Longicatena sp.]